MYFLKLIRPLTSRLIGAIALLSVGIASLSGIPRDNAGDPTIPSFFVENRGQAAPAVRYILKRPGLTAYFGPTGAILTFGDHELPLFLDNASAGTVIVPGQTMEGRGNYFLGGDRSKWATDLPLYQSITFQKPWPGIDIRYSDSGRKLKTDFFVAPGADTSQIRWHYGPGAAVSISPNGNLRVKTADVELMEDAPQLYQDKDDHRIPVSGTYRLYPDGSVGFDLGVYDHQRTLVIDPVINYSSYLGGNGADSITAVALDASGNSIVTGFTASGNMPVTSAVQSVIGGSVDVFVAKFSATGNHLVYCTYFGGSGDDRAFALAVDHSGNAYITGWTGSKNLPLLNPLQNRLASGRDAFVAKLNPTGNALLFSTYLGGNADDIGNGIAVDGPGNVYVVGDTSSTNFPLVIPFQPVPGGGVDVFIAKLNPAGSSIVFSTYLGGAYDEHAAAVALDGWASVYITGSTSSTNFPVAGAFQPMTGGNQDAFVTKLAAGGNFLVYSSYLGGSGGTPGLPETGTGIAVDASLSVYVAGTTSSVNFPTTAGAFQTASMGGNLDAFVSKINPSGSALVYSTYLSGSSIDQATGIAIDFVGNAYVAGYTASQDFPNVRSIQSANHGGYDAFLTKLNQSGTGLLYSTYIGGTSNDSANGIAVDRFGTAFIAGLTTSIDYPIANAAQTTNPDYYAGFVTRVATGWIPSIVTGNAWCIDVAHDAGDDGSSFTAKTFTFGQTGDIPISGDWTGSGQVRMGVFRAGQWLLDINGNGIWDGPSGGDRQISFGQAGDIPVLGDWTGSGTLKAGIFRQGYWILDLSGHLSGVPTGTQDFTFWFGGNGNIPVVGDWTGTGTTKVGVYNGGTWALDWNGDYIFSNADRTFWYGQAGDQPIVGDWDGSGTSKIGIYRNGYWMLNYVGNGIMNTAYSDITFWFGSSGAVPIIMK